MIKYADMLDSLKAPAAAGAERTRNGFSFNPLLATSNAALSRFMESEAAAVMDNPAADMAGAAEGVEDADIREHLVPSMEFRPIQGVMPGGADGNEIQ